VSIPRHHFLAHGSAPYFRRDPISHPSRSMWSSDHVQCVRVQTTAFEPALQKLESVQPAAAKPAQQDAEPEQKARKVAGKKQQKPTASAPPAAAAGAMRLVRHMRTMSRLVPVL